MNGRKSPVVWLSILIFFLISGCNKNIAFVKTTNDSFQVPRWNEIIPGLTTKNEVIEQINKNPSLDQASIQIMRDNSLAYPDYIMLKSPERDYGYVMISLLDDVVQEILINGFSVNLGELITNIGEPEKVLFHIWGTNISVYFIYPKFNIMLVHNSHIFNKAKINITQSIQIDYIFFLSNSSMEKIYQDNFSDYLSRFSSLTSLIIQSWNGYGIYQLPSINRNK